LVKVVSGKRTACLTDTRLPPVSLSLHVFLARRRFSEKKFPASSEKL
jgi:hypothetical protein